MGSQMRLRCSLPEKRAEILCGALLSGSSGPYVTTIFERLSGALRAAVGIIIVHR